MTAEEADEFFLWTWRGWWPISLLEPLPGQTVRGCVTTEDPATALRAALELDRLGEWEQAIEHYQFVAQSASDAADVEYAKSSIERLRELQSLR
jgi:hypothetical protein